MVMGVVLPDFIKNAEKGKNLYPAKEKYIFETIPSQNSILKGWERHVLVDNIFHNSDFFKLQTAALKQIILPIFENSPVKPFFLAHIGLELILDHLLTIDRVVNTNIFYDQLIKTDRQALDSFLQTCSLHDTSTFFKFLDSFISSRYLLSYQKIENISYALNRICMRLWDNPFTDTQVALLTEKLILFKDSLAQNYLSIFEDIELSLNVIRAK